MTDLSGLLGQGVDAIDTPALVIDLDAMERNLARMAAFAKAHQVKLRPHAKMHKSAALAKLQMAAGAVGVCVQKTAEAEALAGGGVTNIYISNEVIAPAKLKRVAALAEQLQAAGGQLAIAVDSLTGIERLAAAAQAQPSAPGPALRIDVFIGIDVGHGRCGISPGAAVVPLVEALAAHPSLVFAGLQAYHGRAQHLRSSAERHAAMKNILADVQNTISALKAKGYAVPLVTGAGSGTFALEAASGVYGELQAGSYLFMDRDYANNEAEANQPQFEHALFVKSQVMSANPQHAVVDAGHKSHAIDSGLPAVHGRALDYGNGGDEHGILTRKASNPAEALPALGETIWLIPGHCDPTVNLHNAMVGVRGGLTSGVVEQIIQVDARGALT